MAKKYLSFIIIPHHRGRQRTISLSNKSIKVFAGILAVLFITLTAFLVDYFIMNGIRQDYKELRAAKEQQDRILAQYEASIGKLNAKIETFEKYRKKLNVMAGLKSEEILELEPGVGGSL